VVYSPGPISCGRSFQKSRLTASYSSDRHSGQVGAGSGHACAADAEIVFNHEHRGRSAAQTDGTIYRAVLRPLTLEIVRNLLDRLARQLGRRCASRVACGTSACLHQRGWGGISGSPGGSSTMSRERAQVTQAQAHSFTRAGPSVGGASYGIGRARLA
jgi:hypothetical protein